MLSRMVRPFAIALFVLCAAGCGGNDPYCGEYVDITGRAAVYCPGVRDEAVCDLEGQRAHYAVGADGRLQLVGGTRARCNEEFEVVCPPGTEGEPYCITDPEL